LEKPEQISAPGLASYPRPSLIFPCHLAFEVTLLRATIVSTFKGMSHLVRLIAYFIRDK